MSSFLFRPPINRRTFLAASTMALAGLGIRPGAKAAAPAVPAPALRKPAKSTVLFFLCGGASHIDMWDMKPRGARGVSRGVPADPHHRPRRSTFASICRCSRSRRIASPSCTASPMAAWRPAIIMPGYYYNLTGHAPDQTFKQQGNDRRPYPDDWPYMGCVVGVKRPPHRHRCRS